LIEPGATSFRVRLLYGDWEICPHSMGFSCGYGTGSSEAPYFDNFLVAVYGSSALGIDLPYDLECPGGYATPSGPTTVSVSGNVTSGECMGPLADVPVDLLTAGGDSFSTMTDSEGNYLFEDVPESDDPGEISIVLPLGFVAVTPPGGDAEIDLSEDRTVDFVLDCGSPTGPARGIGYWKHQAKAYIDGRGHPHETQEDMEINFPQMFFDRFHERPQDAIAIEGVTYIDNGSGPEQVTLETMRSTLTVNNHGTMLDRAKQHYVAMLLNIVSGKLQTYSVVCDNGSTTASQAIQEIANLILDDDESNDEAAKDIAEIINSGNQVPGEMIRDSWPEVLYSPPPPVIELQAGDFMLHPPRPNPCGPSTGIRFEMPQPGLATLRVYDGAGRVVRDIVNEFHAAGDHLLTWDGKDNAGSRLTSGVYFLRLDTQGHTSTRRLIIAN
jgi:hypothetical protein